MLCHNCHNSIHNKNKDNYNKKSKDIFLEFKNTNECSKCGYNKNNGALHFHHKNPENKLFRLAKKRCVTIKELTEEIKNEINLDMYNSGMKQSDIAKKINCAKSTVCMIVKSINRNSGVQAVGLAG